MRENDIKSFIQFIDKHVEGVAIYGTGEAGRLIWSCVSGKLNGKVCMFVDRSAGGECCGLPIIDITSVPHGMGVIIAADPSYKIEKRLITEGIHDWIYIDPVFLTFYCREDDYIESNHNLIRGSSAIIEEVRSLLCEQMSLDIFDEMLSQRENPCMSSIANYYNRGQYFGNDVIPEIEGVFVDCGAYTGDTLARYLQQVRNENWKYYAFESSKKNAAEIKDYARRKHVSDRVTVYNLAVWNEATTLFLGNPTNTNEKTSGMVVNGKQGGVKINADSLDHVLLSNENINSVDIITMDIEGAEINALKGAVKIIKKYHPVLAISIYHQTNHLWDIPYLIHHLDNNYKLYIRHHRWNIADTVCYGIWSET